MAAPKKAKKRLANKRNWCKKIFMTLYEKIWSVGLNISQFAAIADCSAPTLRKLNREGNVRGDVATRIKDKLDELRAQKERKRA